MQVLFWEVSDVNNRSAQEWIRLWHDLLADKH